MSFKGNCWQSLSCLIDGWLTFYDHKSSHWGYGSGELKRNILALNYVHLLSHQFKHEFGCSKELSHWDSSFEYKQHMFWLKNKKNSCQLRTVNCRPETIPRASMWWHLFQICFQTSLEIPSIPFPWKHKHGCSPRACINQHNTGWRDRHQL